MKQKNKKKSFLENHPEAKGLFLIGIAALMLLSLLSFHPQSPRENWLGLVGFGIGYGLTYLVGLGGFLLMFYLGFLGFQYLSKGAVSHIKAKHLYFGTFLVSCCLLLNLIAELKAPFPDILQQKVPVETIILQLPYPQMHIRFNLGGVPLYYLYRDLPTLNLMHLLSNVGIGITFSIIALVSMLLFTETKANTLWRSFKRSCSWVVESFKTIELPKKKEPAPVKAILEEELIIPEPFFSKEVEKPKPKQVKKAQPVVTRRAEAIRAQRVVNGEFSHFKIPPSQLLRSPQRVDLSSLKKDLRRQAERLEETLLSFGIEAKVSDIHCGPTITSFEVQPSVGVKVQKIKALENDIALNLQARSIRIIAPIPGKAAVGIEIPSIIQQEVSFKELLMAYQQKKQKAQIPILLGKTVSGELVLSDLAKMPHCIIAGATGSGKSVCINTIVLSIVMNARPDEIKLLMIDPKKVELTGYTNLPHMIAPVITEAHGAYAALSWLVKEMQKRYDILKQMGLRNISAFNARKRDLKFEESLNIEIPEKMPKFVAIIDEFADLMMASSSDLETPIARIAQMARAVGIHMILATQRPSREVITGLIKANFPTRIAFKVASRINSQIILDETGAENLLGNGDMLFLPPGTSNLMRAQGSYISDDEINQVIRYICDQAPPNYLIPSFDTMPKEDLSILAGVEDESKDQLYDDALSTVVETGTASTTFLQRKLKIGYARAASLMDELERNGVIGPQEGAKPRRVLINSSNED
jgi:S-DNA-T family DNA segregation ATPase FtsK/SpoIIIE